MSQSLSREAVALLTDGLLHNARNPLNALSIHVEVLSERLRRDFEGGVPPTHEKSLRTMRDQVQRVDAILRQFAEFLAPTGTESGPTDLSEVVARALDVVGHECRKRQLRVNADVSPGVLVRVPRPELVRQLVLQTLVMVLGEAQAGVTLRVEVNGSRDAGRLTVGRAAHDLTSSAVGVDVCRQLSESCGGSFTATENAMELTLPLVSAPNEGVK